MRKRYLSIFFLILILLSLSRLAPYYVGIEKSKKDYQKVEKIVVQKGDKNEIEKNKGRTKQENEDVVVDVDALKELSEDAIGWIRFDNTDVMWTN